MNRNSDISVIGRIEAPVISILMAVYNVEQFLPETIDSVIGQTYGRWELICINDGSTDKSLLVLEHYKSIDPRISVIARKHCGKVAAVRNAGLAIARGRYIAMLDSDDKLEPPYLAKLIAKQQQTEADIVVASICYWDTKSDTMLRTLAGVSGDTDKMIGGKEAFELSLHWTIGAIGLHRADTLKKLKYSEVGMLGDEYTVRLLFLLAETVAFSDAVYLYRQHAESHLHRFSYRHLSNVTNQSLLLPLIRQNQLRGPFFVAYKEEVVMSALEAHITLLSRRKQIPLRERRIARGLLMTATVAIGREFFLPPFALSSLMRIGKQVLAIAAMAISKLWRRCTVDSQ